MKAYFATAAAAALLVLPFTVADCDIFKVGEERSEGYTMSHNTTFAVSRGVNCTEDWARSGEDGEKECDWEVPRRAVGLIVHPYLDPIRVDAEQAAPGATRGLDFNETIVMRFTPSITRTALELGRSGHAGFTPHLRCFDGTLGGCGGGDGPIRDDTAIRACGYVVRNPGGDTPLYAGDENFVTTASISDEDPQPPYEEVAGNATVNRDQPEDGESGALSLGAGFSVLMAAAVSLAVLL